MPMEACLDESGIHSGSKRIVLAGFAGGRQKIKALEKSWMEILSRFDVPLEIGFHAKVFFKQSGPYYRWSGQRSKDFIDAIVEQIRIHEVKPIGACVSTEVFHRQSHNFRRWITGGQYDVERERWLSSGAPTKPYFFVFHQALIRGCADAKPGVRVDFIFDRQDNFSSLVFNLWNILKGDPRWKGGAHLGGVAFYSRFERPCLQLADFLAFCLYHIEEYSKEARNHHIRYAISRLVEEKVGVADMDKAIEVLQTVYPARLREEDEAKSGIRGLQRGNGYDPPRRSKEG